MKAQYNYKEGKLDESYFFKLSEDDFAELCNIPYDDILQSFTELIGKNPYVYINMNAIGLTILTAYDSLPENSNRKAKMAQVAIDIYDYLYNSGDKQSSTMYYLNKLQVIKRIRPFDDGESATINQILYSNDYDDASKCVAALLSENKSAFMYYWESLNKEHRARIENYPIWKFHSELH
jgi:hypothetical protein